MADVDDDAVVEGVLTMGVLFFLAAFAAGCGVEYSSLEPDYSRAKPVPEQAEVSSQDASAPVASPQEEIDPPVPDEGPGGTEEQTETESNLITYSGQMLKKIEGQCLGCHSAGAVPPDLSSYEAAVSSAQESLDEVLAGSMPPGGALEPEDQQLWQSWWDDGLL